MKNTELRCSLRGKRKILFKLLPIPITFFFLILLIINYETQVTVLLNIINSSKRAGSLSPVPFI